MQLMTAPLHGWTGVVVCTALAVVSARVVRASRAASFSATV